MRWILSTLLILGVIQTKAQQLSLTEMETVFKTESIDSLNIFLNSKKYFLVNRNYNKSNEGIALWAFQSNQNIDINFRITPFVRKLSKFHTSKKYGASNTVIEYFIDSTIFESMYNQLKSISLDKIKVDINKYNNSITYRFTVVDKYFANLARIKQQNIIFGGEKIMSEYFTLTISTYSPKKATSFLFRAVDY